MDEAAQSGLLQRVLDCIERAGNRLPAPLTIFVGLALALLPLSALAAWSGWSAEHPVEAGRIIEPVNLLAPEQLQRVFTEAVDNFVTFPPLGVVLVVMLGIGIAERGGLIAAVLRLVVLGVPRPLLSGALVFAGVLSSLAADAGYVVLTPLGAVLFAGLGRHPLAGLCAAFAGVSAGFSANLLLTSLDPLLAAFTLDAARIFDADYTLTASANYYFMLASTPLLTLAGWWVTERIVVPRLGEWEGHAEHASDIAEPLSALQRRGLMWAGVAAGSATLLIALLVVPEAGLLRGEDGGLGPFYSALAFLMALFFFAPGLAYAIATREVRNDRDVARITGDTIGTMGAYIVLAFAAAQFVAYFKWSNIGLLLSLSGASLLDAIGFVGLPLLLGFVLVAGVINLFVGSASAKWALMAPVLVPMGMALGLSPEVVQAAYRVGDSVTNIITPLNPYFPIVIAFGQQYVPGLRLGTLIAAMLPYAVVFAIVWSLLFALWFLLGLPMGPGAGLDYALPAG